MVDNEQQALERNRLDPEDAGAALARVEALLRRHQLVESLVHRQEEEAGSKGERSELVESLVHRQHLNELATELDSLHPADVAYILEALAPQQRLIVWDLVRAERDGEILLEVSDAVRETLIAAMDRDELVAATENLEADEIADLAPDLPDEVMREVTQGLTAEEREQLRAAMSYPEDSVGARMDFDMVTIRDDVTLEVVLRYMRRFDKLPDHTNQVFVVDRADVLKGALPIDRLLVNEPEVMVQDAMDTEILTLSPLDDADEAAQAFERYDLVSAAVVDAGGKLIGRLTVNEVVDVIRERSEEQTLSAAGLREEEDIFAPIADAVKNRAPWLLLNLCTASTAAFVASRFANTVAQIVILAFLMSIVAGIAGNSGNQTMTLIIRALALGQITLTNVRRLMKKELTVTLLIGVGGGFIAGLFAWAISGRLTLGLVMMAAMVLNLLVGAAVGMVVPLLRAKFGKDPAIGSSVMLTFVTDTLGFFIFLELATWFLL
jgi:magnesium transporter